MRRRAVLAATAAAFCAGSVVAIAADADKVITACVTQEGEVRILTDSAPACIDESETSLSWNATGPVGPTGSPGPKGDTGSTGATGAAGTTAILGGAATEGAFDPADLSATDRKAYDKAAKGAKKVKDQKVVSGKQAAVATCDPVKKPDVPGQCAVKLAVTDYLQCPSGYPVAVDHSVTPYPGTHPAGDDAGRPVPYKPPFVGYGFRQNFDLSPFGSSLLTGEPVLLPKTASVAFSKSAGGGTSATVPGPLGLPGTTFELPGVAVTYQATVRAADYAPVTQSFGVREYLVCEKGKRAR